MAHLNVNDLWILYAVLLPIAVGVATKRSTTPAVKAVVHITAVVVAAAIKAAIDKGGVFAWNDFIMTTVVTYVVGIGAYAGFIKPTGIAEYVQLWTKDFGLGSGPDPGIEVVPSPPVDSDSPQGTHTDLTPTS